ncbi:MAG TPA: M1 family metallopeptidase [Nocardioides sp.]|uniref:M1 family metallopeptidase n=1 Tax=Nocardioides sp. TaxID=35761 RepID=UPI002BC8BB03|nr:M1 family metallopeptidase [Nocardioides sp.]HQR25723.1 M1 family metallopeptidase [Nocardioides sp.]
MAGPGAAGIGDDYFPLDGNGGYDVKRYDVHVAYDFRTAHLSGWTRLTLRTTEDLSRFNLDFLLPVTAVRVAGRPAGYTRPVRHELQITPSSPLRRGTRARVLVRYAGYPRRYTYAGESNWLAGAGEVVAMNQPHMAPWWFPGNDHPLDRARMDVHVTVPAGRQVVSNGVLAGCRRHGDRTTWHWRAREPMVPYLAFFAAGRFEIEQGRVRHGRLRGLPWLVAVSRDVPAPLRPGLMRLMRRSPAVVGWLSAELGRYPFSSTGGLVTGLDPGFALENQTRPTYPAVAPGSVGLVVHELAHQWFGDDVAVRHWKDIWLNEGFATYMEHRYAETHGGRSTASWLRARYDSLPPSNRFWALSLADPGPGHLFDSPVYLRGAMALAALRDRIGEPDFRVLLRTWVRRHGGRTGSTDQFRALASAVSGEELAGFFDAWLVARAKPADTAANGLG